MLIVVLNHNLPQLTDNCAEQLSRSLGNNKLWVVDNGSDKAPPANSTTHKLPENIYLGGAFNVVLEEFNSSNHDYLFFLNNDLIFHGYELIPTILDEVKSGDWAMYSPSVINAGIGQCHWKEMWNWGTKSVRQVPFIDFQSPVIRKDFTKLINRFPDELFHYGLDFYSAILAEKNNLKIGVSDNITFCHLSNETATQNMIEGFTEQTFPAKANQSMYNYFMNSEYKNDYIKMRQVAENYGMLESITKPHNS